MSIWTDFPLSPFPTLTHRSHLSLLEDTSSSLSDDLHQADPRILLCPVAAGEKATRKFLSVPGDHRLVKGRHKRFLRVFSKIFRVHQAIGNVSRVIFLFFRAFADSVFLTVLLAGMDISRPMNGISFPFCGYDFDGLDGILSGISCTQKKTDGLPPAFSSCFFSFPFTCTDTRPEGSIYISRHLPSRTYPRPHNRSSCRCIPRWRLACSSHIHPAA